LSRSFFACFPLAQLRTLAKAADTDEGLLCHNGRTLNDAAATHRRAAQVEAVHRVLAGVVASRCGLSSVRMDWA